MKDRKPPSLFSAVSAQGLYIAYGIIGYCEFRNVVCLLVFLVFCFFFFSLYFSLLLPPPPPPPPSAHVWPSYACFARSDFPCLCLYVHTLGTVLLYRVLGASVNRVGGWGVGEDTDVRLDHSFLLSPPPPPPKKKKNNNKKQQQSLSFADAVPLRLC